MSKSIDNRSAKAKVGKMSRRSVLKTGAAAAAAIAAPHVRNAEAATFNIRMLIWQDYNIDEKRLCLEALELFLRYRISFADAYAVAHMNAREITEIYSWDMDFDRIEGLTRVAPT
jgi:predicted nucleic acid-binding protein